MVQGILCQMVRPFRALNVLGEVHPGRWPGLEWDRAVGACGVTPELWFHQVCIDARPHLILSPRRGLSCSRLRFCDQPLGQSSRVLFEKTAHFSRSGGEGREERSPNHSRTEPVNHPTHDFAKTPGAFLPLRVGGVGGADGEGRGEVSIPPFWDSWGGCNRPARGRLLASSQQERPARRKTSLCLP